MSEQNIIALTKAIYSKDSKGERITIFASDNAKVGTKVKGAAKVKRVLFAPNDMTRQELREMWEDIMEQLGKDSEVVLNDQYYGSIDTVALPPRYATTTDARGNKEYLKNQNGDKIIVGEFKTIVFDFETIQNVTEQYRRRVAEEDWIKTSTVDVEE